MKRSGLILLVFIAVFSIISGITAAELSAKNNKDITGWEKDSEYNKLYEPGLLSKLKGKVVKFKEVTPLSGMAPGTAFILEESDDEKTLVHLCPVSYADARETGLKRGDKVSVKGSWAEIDGKDVFIAAKVKKGDYFEFKVRLTSDGTPYWTMTPEQLAKERKSSDQ